MYRCNTFTMVHPDHGECVADETAEAGLVALGWKREGAEDLGDDLGAGSQESGEEALPPAGLVVPPAAAAQGAKVSAGRSPAAQGAKAN